MTSEPQTSSDQPLLSRDPLTSYIGPHCVRVLDSGEPLMAVNPRGKNPLVSMIVIMDAEGGSETTITAIKEETLEPESCSEVLQDLLDSDMAKELSDPLDTVKVEPSDSTQTVKEEHSDSESFREENEGTHWSLRRIFTELNTDEQCIEFAIEKGLLPAEKICHRHKTPMTLQLPKKKNNQKRTVSRLGVFCCRKVGCRQNNGSKITRSSGTCFENLQMPLNNLFQMMYMFCYHHKCSHYEIQKQMTRHNGYAVSSGCISLWHAICKEAIIVYHLKHQDPKHKIGGPGRTVYIELSNMGERKHRISKHIGGQWVVGLVEIGNNDIWLELCVDNQELVIPMIVLKHVKPGTKVHMDTFTANHCLSQGGFKLISSKIKIKEENKPTDSNWKMMKAIFKKDRFPGNFTDWLIEYSWRRDIKTSNKCAFEELLKAVQYFYSI